MTSTTSTSVTSIVHWMSWNASRMFFERSPRMVRCTEGGSARSKVGSSLRIASVTSIVLLPGWRITDRLIARWPPSFVYSHDAFMLFSTSSMTLAMLIEADGRAVAIGDDRAAGTRPRSSAGRSP